MSAGDTTVVKTLLAKRANVNAVTRGGWTSLMGADETGHADVVRELLANGANARPRTMSGRRP